jgi:hypothetical protein
MKFLKKLFGTTERKPEEDPFANAPVFKRMMEDMKKEQEGFLDMFGKIVPIVKYGKVSGGARKVIINGQEHEMPEQSGPVTFPIAFDDLSLIFGIDRGAHYEWLQNKHIEVAKAKITINDIVEKAYGNLLAQVKGNIKIEMIGEKTGMLVQCDALESSFILVDEIWDHIRSTIDAKEVAFAIPTQDVFIFCDADKKEIASLLGEKSKGVFDNPVYQKKISPRLYVKKENGAVEILKG